MKKQLSKLIIKTALLAVVLILSDRTIGTWLEHLFYKQTHGDDYTTLYALEKAQDKIMIFGTSRASHHYNATIISEETGFKCFNAGRDEMEIPYTEALLKVILPGHRIELNNPGAYLQMIILDIGPLELSGDKQVVYERIAAALMPFNAKYKVFDRVIAKAGKLELWKTKLSKIYPYNSKIGSAFQNSYTNLGHHSEQGYEPLYKTIDTTVYKKSIWKDMDKNLPVNPDYLVTLDNIIATAKANDINLVIVISPFYFYNDFSKHDSYNMLKQITAQHPEVTLLDFSNDPQFTGQPLLFNDDVHLNDSGAAIYTRKVVEQLRSQGFFNQYPSN